MIHTIHRVSEMGPGKEPYSESKAGIIEESAENLRLN